MDSTTLCPGTIAPKHLLNWRCFYRLVTLYLNLLNGKFAKGGSYSGNTYPNYIIAADLNGDSIVDLAVSYLGSNNMTIFWGKGSGTFVQGPSYVIGINPVSLAVGDVNGDGFPDLALSYTSGVKLLLGSSSGAFTPGRLHRGIRRHQRGLEGPKR